MKQYEIVFKPFNEQQKVIIIEANGVRLNEQGTMVIFYGNLPSIIACVNIDSIQYVRELPNYDIANQ